MCIRGLCCRPAGLHVAGHSRMQCAGSGEGSARPAGGKTASERSGTHPMHAGRYGAYKLHGVGSRGNPDAATAAHAARIAQAHTLPWAAARGALIAQGAETRQNTLQSAPRRENDIGGRHMIVRERSCRRKCQKARIASTSRRGAPPPPFTAPPHSRPATCTAPTARPPLIISRRRPRNSAKEFRIAILDRPSEHRAVPIHPREPRVFVVSFSAEIEAGVGEKISICHQLAQGTGTGTEDTLTRIEYTRRFCRLKAH